MPKDLEPLDLAILQTLDDVGDELSYQELEERCGLQDDTGRKAIFAAVYRLASHPDVPFVDVVRGRIRLLPWGRDLLHER